MKREITKQMYWINYLAEWRWEDGKMSLKTDQYKLLYQGGGVVNNLEIWTDRSSALSGMLQKV